MYKSFRKNAIAVVGTALLAYLVFLLLKLSWVKLFDHEFQLSLAQLIVYPLVLIVCWKAGRSSNRVPNLVFLFAVLGCIVGVSGSYFVNPKPARAIVLTKLAGDPHGSESRIFSDLLDENLTDLTNHRIAREPTVAKKYKKVEKILKSTEQDIEAVIWGGVDWVNVTHAALGASKLESEGLLSTGDPKLGLKKSYLAQNLN